MTASPWWVPIAVAAITAGFAREIFTWGRGLLKGRTPRRTELEKAWDAADEQARRRRVAEEHAARLKRLLIAAPCVDDSLIPPDPEPPRRTGPIPTP